MKTRIIEQLGHDEILVPALISKAWAANDRVKIRMSALQAAARAADSPERTEVDLGEECRRAGLDPLPLEKLLGSAVITSGRLTAPGLSSLEAAIWKDVEEMAEPVRAAHAAEQATVERRLAHLKASLALEPDDTMPVVKIGRLTAGAGEDGKDTLHRLVMDLHKTVNRLATLYSEEELVGAHVHGLTSEDHAAVEAFMRGVNATKKLKFDHPGLATTAIRSGSRLLIQNDIGETDAHVVMVDVEDQRVTVTYTDVHLSRAQFFRDLLRNFSVQWSGVDRTKVEGLREEAFFLVVGRLDAADLSARNAFLEAIGGSLVFLIDWNKARKVLRSWVSNRDAISVLDWAARHRFGHRGFLSLGGAELIGSAVRHATPTRIGFGEQLDHALGRNAAVDFLKTVLRVSTEALLEGGSVRLARDRIEADLVRHLQRLDGLLLDTVICQLGLAGEIGASLSRFIGAQLSQRQFDATELAASARRIEEKADRLALNARREMERFDADGGMEQLINLAEQTIDDFEQAAFIASLVPNEIEPDVLDALASLCGAATNAIEAAVRGAAAAAEVPDGQRVDSEDALNSVAQLIDCEHRADAAERAVVTLLLRRDLTVRKALPALEFARAIERATDRLAAFGHVLRGRIVSQLAS